MSMMTVQQLSQAAAGIGFSGGGFSSGFSFTYIPSPYAYSAASSFGGWQGNPFAAPPPRNPFAAPLPDPQQQPGPDSLFRSDPFGTNPPAEVGAVSLSAIAGLAGFAIFAVIGFLGQEKQNKAIAKASKLSQERVNLHLTNMRVNHLLEIVQIAHRGQKALGNVLNALSSRGISKLESISNQIVDATSLGTWAQFTSMEREDENARQQREIIAARASAGQTSPIVTALGDGAKGFQIGVQAASAFQSAAEAREMNIERQKGFQHRNFGFQADMRGFESSLRNSGIDFGNAENMALLTTMLSRFAIEAGEKNISIASGYRAVEERRGDFLYNDIFNSSIGSGESPFNLPPGFGFGE